MLIEFTLGDMVEGLSPEGRDGGGLLSDRGGLSVHTHGGYTIGTHTHTHRRTVFG